METITEEVKKRNIKSTDERIEYQIELLKKLKAKKKREVKNTIISTFNLFERDESLLKILQSKKGNLEFQIKLEDCLKNFLKEYLISEELKVSENQ